MQTSSRWALTGFWLLLVVLTPNARATLSYWDPQGAWGSYSTYTAGSLDGVWENSSWSRNLTGGAGTPADQGQAVPIGWTDGDAAVFAVGAGATNGIGGNTNTVTFTVTVNSDHTIAGIFDGALNPNSCKVTIVGTGLLNLAAGLDAFDVANSSDTSVAFVTVSNTIAGPGVITAEGNGQIFLNGTNTYTGGTQLGYYIAPNGSSFSGIINFNSTASFGTGSIIISNLATSTAALVVEGTNAVAITNSVLVNTTNNPSLNIVGNPTGVTFSGPWNLNNRTLSIGSGVSGNLVIISGVVSGTGGLTKFNPGALRLTAPNTYSGKTTIQNGSLSVSSLNSVGGGSPSSSLGVPTTAAAGTIGLGATTTAGVLIYTGVGETTDRVIDLAGTTGGGTIQNDGSGPLVFTTNFTASGAGAKTLTLQGTNTGNNTISGKIVNSSSATSVTKSGTGTWTLAGTNTYTGNTTLNSGGRLNLANSSALGGGTLVIGGNGTFDNISGTDLTFANGITCSGGSPTFAGSSNMTLSGAALITGANRTITVTSNTLTLGSALGDSGQNRGLTKNGAGTLVLANGGTYGGNTTINAGKFVITGSGSLANSSSVTIAAGTIFDVSGRSSTTYTLGSSASLTARGAGTTPGVDAATIVGASGGVVSLGSRPISLTFTPTLFNGDSTHPSLYISQGTLSLNGNSFTVTNASGTPLGVGTYVLIQQASGNITSSGIYPATVTGGVTAGNAGYISVSGGTVNLIVAPAVSFSGLTPSQTIITGAVNIALSGTVSGAGPIYPAMGETVTVVINGNSQSTTINDATGDFSINYNPSTIPYSFTPYPIAYFYPGNGTTMSAAFDTSTTLTVNSPVSHTNVLQSITNNANGSFTLNLVGTPSAIYYIVTSSNVSQSMSTWTTVPGSTNTISGSGSWSFTVSNAAPAFYRSVAVNPGP